MLTSADNACKQFGPRLGLAFVVFFFCCFLLFLFLSGGFIWLDTHCLTVLWYSSKHILNVKELMTAKMKITKHAHARIQKVFSEGVQL